MAAKPAGRRRSGSRAASPPLLDRVICECEAAPEGTVKYRVYIEQDEDGVFVAEAPSLPGCISQGATRAEALANIKEAIELYIESLEAHGDPIPPSITEEVIEVSV